MSSFNNDNGTVIISCRNGKLHVTISGSVTLNVTPPVNETEKAPQKSSEAEPGINKVTSTDDTYFNVPQLMEYLKCSKSTAYKLLESGQLQAKKVGRLWRISKNTVDAYLKAVD